MSKKITVLIAGLFASLAFVFTLAGTMQGCGGSSGGDYSTLCNKACDKAAACNPDAGAAISMYCKTACTAGAAQHCSNQSAINSKIQECLNMSDCTKAEACGATIPACQSTTGTGGSTGAGGTTGTGGSTGTGGTSGGGWTCQDQPGQGCTCIQDPSGNLTSCPSSYTCCFTATVAGIATCNCTTPPSGATCAQYATAAGGAVVSHCPQ